MKPLYNLFIKDHAVNPWKHINYVELLYRYSSHKLCHKLYNNTNVSYNFIKYRNLFIFSSELQHHK